MYVVGAQLLMLLTLEQLAGLRQQADFLPAIINGQSEHHNFVRLCPVLTAKLLRTEACTMLDSQCRGR